MGNDLGRRNGPEPPAVARRPAAAITEEEARGIEVARPRRIHHPGHRRRIDRVGLLAGEHQRAAGAAGERRQLAGAAGLPQRLVEIIDLPEGADLRLIGEEDVDMLAQQVAERGAVPVDAEGVGEREGDLAAAFVSDAGRLDEGLLRRRRIEEIAFQIRHPRPQDQRRIDVRRAELNAGAEIGVHGALGVGRDEDEAARRRRAGVHRRRVEGDARRADVMGEDPAERIPADLADITRPALEGGDSGDGVGSRAAGDLDRRAHGRVEGLGPLGVDQGHGPFAEPVLREEGLLGMGQHVDDGIADADDVEERFGHGRLQVLSRRIRPKNRGGLCRGGPWLARPAPVSIMARPSGERPCSQPSPDRSPSSTTLESTG